MRLGPVPLQWHAASTYLGLAKARGPSTNFHTGLTCTTVPTFKDTPAGISPLKYAAPVANKPSNSARPGTRATTTVCCNGR